MVHYQILFVCKTYIIKHNFHIYTIYIYSLQPVCVAIFLKDCRVASISFRVANFQLLNSVAILCLCRVTGYTIHGRDFSCISHVKSELSSVHYCTVEYTLRHFLYGTRIHVNVKLVTLYLRFQRHCEFSIDRERDIYSKSYTTKGVT